MFWVISEARDGAVVFISVSEDVAVKLADNYDNTIVFSAELLVD